MQERLSRGPRQLPPIHPGDQVQLQDQHGNTPRQWSKTSVVVEAGGFDSYLISLDGSRQLTKRNRKFLRKISPHPDSYKHSESTQPTPVTVRPPPTTSSHSTSHSSVSSRTASSPSNTPDSSCHRQHTHSATSRNQETSCPRPHTAGFTTPDTSVLTLAAQFSKFLYLHSYRSLYPIQ